jgi:hypothetical protein
MTAWGLLVSVGQLSDMLYLFPSTVIPAKAGIQAGMTVRVSTVPPSSVVLDGRAKILFNIRAIRVIRG